MSQTSPHAASAYAKRWKKIRALQLRELWRTPPKEKFFQFLSLVSAPFLFKKGDKRRLRAILTVKKRWLQLQNKI